MDYREIDRLKKSPEAFRSLAAFLLRLPDPGWTEWELDFLESVSQRAFEEGPSTRQCEVLADLRDGATTLSQVDGLSVKAMIDGTWRARFDLDEDDEQFVDTLYKSGASAIKKRTLRRLLTCARKVEVIEGGMRL